MKYTLVKDPITNVFVIYQKYFKKCSFKKMQATHNFNL